MGIISPHIVHYGDSTRESTGEIPETFGKTYRCMACQGEYDTVYRVCPECSGYTRRVD